VKDMTADAEATSARTADASPWPVSGPSAPPPAAARSRPSASLSPPPDPAATQWITVAEAAAYAHVSASILYREVQARRLRAARLGGRRNLRLRRDWIDAWLEASATPVELGFEPRTRR
jgi:excisionase family DNA binding protein